MSTLSTEYINEHVMEHIAFSIPSEIKSPRAFLYPDGDGAVIFYRDKLDHLCVRGYNRYHKNNLGCLIVENPYNIQDEEAITIAQRIYGRRTMRFDTNLPLSKRLHLIHHQSSTIEYYGGAGIRYVSRSDRAKIKIMHGIASVLSNNKWG